MTSTPADNTATSRPRIALVTGAGGGIGSALVSKLLSLSYHVIAVTRPGGRLCECATAYSTNAISMSADLRDDACVRDLAQNALNTVPHIDLLISAAAVCHNGWYGFTDAFNVNARAPARLIKYLTQALLAARNPLVVNISSGDGELCYMHTALQQQLNEIAVDTDRNPGNDASGRIATADCVLNNAVRQLDEITNRIECVTAKQHRASVVYGEQPAYALSKACLNAITRVAAKVYAPRVRVVAVCPGDVLTKMGPNTATITPYLAARDIVELALRLDIKSGCFYRHGDIIQW